ncbi:MAG: hypothetical protein JNJ77_11945 [Planctomycetia bacterium]|nr:hypothetical protein [Planctomycetia bacterium]
MGVLIHEEVQWLDRVEMAGLPGGYMPWMIGFGILGGGLMSAGVWVIASRKAAVQEK